MSREFKQPWQIAALIAELMRRAGATRARLSDKQLLRLSGRKKRLETSIREAVKNDLFDYGYILHKLDASGKFKTSGYAIVAVSALHAAKPLKVLTLLDEDELEEIDEGTFDFDTLHFNLIDEDEDQGEDD